MNGGTSDKNREPALTANTEISRERGQLVWRNVRTDKARNWCGEIRVFGFKQARKKLARTRDCELRGTAHNGSCFLRLVALSFENKTSRAHVQLAWSDKRKRPALVVTTQLLPTRARSQRIVFGKNHVHMYIRPQEVPHPLAAPPKQLYLSAKRMA